MKENAMKIPKTLVFPILASLLLIAVIGQARGNDAPPLLDKKSPEAVEADLGALVPRLMTEARIPGLQIALIRDGRVVWHRSFGVANAKTSAPVTDDTIFEAASFTKPFFAYYVMKLVEQGLVDLDKPFIGGLPREEVEKMLDHPLDEKGFRRDWFEKITARQVLSHSSGMPHGERGKPFPLLFEPGTKWKYSAEGYFFLQKAVERLKGDKLENLMRKEVIEPLGMTRSSLVWRDEYDKTMANGHGFFGRPEDFRKRTEAHAAATLYTTVEDYAKFICAVLNGTGLRPETLKTMLTPQIDMDKEKGLGWSLGFGTQTDSNGQAFWQWGDYGIFRNYIFAYPREKMAVIYFTNSFYGLGIGPDLVKHSLGGEDMAGVALKYWPYDSPIYRLGWDLEAKGPQAAGELKGLMGKNPGVFDRDAIGFLAETLLEAGLAPQAIALLESNAREHPRSGSAQADLGKVYLAQGDRTRARKAFETARAAEEDKVEASVIEWNLEDIRALDHPLKLEEAALQRIAGDYGPRHLEFRDGRLYYSREGGTYSGSRPLTPMTPDTFLIEGASDFRLKVEFDDKGVPVKLVGLYQDGRRDATARNK
jgi:CubicO group peptidase (beta-lactamase class C family)